MCLFQSVSEESYQTPHFCVWTKFCFPSFVLQSHCVCFGAIFVVRESRAVFPQVCVSGEGPSDETEVVWFQGQSNAWLVPGKEHTMLQKNQVLRSSPHMSRHSLSTRDLLYDLLYVLFSSSFTFIAEKYLFRCQSGFHSLYLWDFARLEQLSHSQSLLKPGTFCLFGLKRMSLAGLSVHSPPTFADLLAAALATVVRKVDLNCSW